MRRFSVSLPTAGLLIGLLVGIIGTILVYRHWGQFGEIPDIPRWSWLTIPWTWMTVCCLTGLIFSSERLGRFRWIPIMIAGPGLLLLSRGSSSFKALTHLSTKTFLLLWFLTIVALSVPLLFVRLHKTAHLRAYVAGTLASLGALVLIALDLRAADYLPVERKPRTQTKPNVVLVFLDTVTYADSVGSGKIVTPNLTKFAEHAITFDNAWAPASWTIPSHYAVLFGIEPWEAPPSSEAVRAMTYPTLAQRFQRRGYATAAIFSNNAVSPYDGFDRGFDEFTYSRGTGPCRSAIGNLLWRSGLNDGPRMPICNWFAAREITSRAEHFVRRAREPFFLALNYLDTHEPYYVPKDCRDPSFRLARRAERTRFLVGERNAENDARMHRQYRMAMLCLDRSLGNLFAALERNDPGLSNTIVVLAGDHGEMFGEHGQASHGYSAYRAVLHVPMIIKVPRGPQIRISDPVSISDLYPTLVRAADGGAIPLLDAKQRREVISTSTLYDGRTAFSIAKGDFHFIRYSDGQEQLFDLRTDPDELHSIPSNSLRAMVDPLRETVLRASRIDRGSAAFDALGYLNH